MHPVSAFQIGERVTILPPYDRDPVIVEHQRYGNVARVFDLHPEPEYLVTLPDAFPANERFGPFPHRRLAKGWAPR